MRLSSQTSGSNVFLPWSPAVPATCNRCSIVISSRGSFFCECRSFEAFQASSQIHCISPGSINLSHSAHPALDDVSQFEVTVLFIARQWAGRCSKQTSILRRHHMSEKSCQPRKLPRKCSVKRGRSPNHGARGDSGGPQPGFPHRAPDSRESSRIEDSSMMFSDHRSPPTNPRLLPL
jgi:hypothetical protein